MPIENEHFIPDALLADDAKNALADLFSTRGCCGPDVERTRTIVRLLFAAGTHEHAGAVQQQRTGVEPLRRQVHLQGEVVEYLFQLAMRGATDNPMNRMVGEGHLESLQ